MTCPYCNGEMSFGRLEIWDDRSTKVFSPLNGYHFEWIAEEEFDKKGLFASFKRNKIKMKSILGEFVKAYHCPKCRKAFGEFAEQEPNVKPADHNSLA